MNLMTRKEIAEYLKVSVVTIDNYEKQGMPVLRPTKKITPRYCLEDILKWMKEKKGE